MRELTLRELQRLARILGVAIGQGYAAAVLAAEDAAAVPAPPTPVDGALASIVALFPEWLQEAGQTPRAKGSAQARMRSLVQAYVRVVEEQGDEPGEGKAPG